ncbi:MAG: amino acid permease [Gemmatimonadaceae bacterium]|nr:amino acid permease [Gemmatimonadaceae bacterium]
MVSPLSADSAGTERVGYDARLGTFSGTMLVVGGIIGAGIFLSPAVVAQRVGSAALTLGAWGLGAVVAIIGGFIYAELGARRPLAGGTYVYLRDAWGPLPAFLYGWALFLIMATGAIAAVGMTGASYLATLLGLPTDAIRPLAIGIIAVLTLLNVLGVRIGATTGNVLTVLKLAAIGILVLAALVLSPTHAGELTGAVAAPPALAIPVGGSAVVLAMGAALVPVLFSYGGWQQTNAVAEELVDPSRTLPRALIIGVLVVVATYMLVNIAYLRALGVDGLAASTAPAADTMFVYLGPMGRTLITCGIVASTVGFLSMVILMSARVYQAMAADGLFFRSMATLHPRTRTPVAALLAQGVVALALLLTGTYGQLLDYVVFADWIFFGSTAAALFVLRARDMRDGIQPSVRTPFHPYSTLIFIAAAMYVVIGSITSNPGNAARGAALLALGLPVFAYWRRQSAASR